MKHKRVLVIGLGGLGRSLVEELWDTHVEIMVIDKSESAIDAVKDKAGAAFVADGSDPGVLEGVGAKDVDVAVITYAEDFESSVLVVASLAQLKVPAIFARASNDRQAAVLRAVGATRVILVEHEMGRRLAPEVLSPVSADLVEYASSFRVVPWEAKGNVLGKTVSEFNGRYADLNVLGYWREGAAGPLSVFSRKRRPILPAPTERIVAGDTLLLIGLHDAVEKFLAGDWE